MSAPPSFWEVCLKHFEATLPQQQFRTWIAPLRASIERNSLVLTAPNRFVMQWVKDRFVPVIQDLARNNQLDGLDVQLQLGTRTPVAESAAAAATDTIAVPPAAKPRPRETSRLNPGFNFDSFVLGRANQLARAAALQVAEHPGTAYNPLFIYGGVGLGKTHLLQAIGNLVQEREPATKLRYIHAEQ
jgi:chromosomal replication initiator protein